MKARAPLCWGMALAAAAFGGCAHQTPAQARAEEVLSQAKTTRMDLEVHCAPSDAEVVVDEVPRGLCSDYQAPGTGLRLGEGMHRVAVRRSGYAPYVTYYEPSGARLSLSIQLQSNSAEGAKP